MVNCAICESLKNPRTEEFWNEPLFQTDHFVVLPSLGSMIEGWLLVIPKGHVLCMGALPLALEREYRELHGKVRGHVADLYGMPVVSFEHGPNSRLKRTGCGVDHAHVHVVPFSGDLIELSTPYLGESSGWYIADAYSQREAYSSGLDYLYAEVPGRGAVMATSAEFGSQVFRRAIADYLNIPHEYQWREFLRLDTVATTVRHFRNGSTPISHGAEYAA